MTTTQQDATTYAIDPAHSRVSFAVRHLMISKVRGEFTRFSGSVTTGTNALPTNIAASIDVSSISTHEPDRDNHLKSPDFFEAETYPTITFESTDIRAGNGDEFTIAGNLTLHGTTKPIELQAHSEGAAKDPWGKNRVAYSARGRINRKEFGLVWNQAMETGGVIVGDDIDITLDIEAVA